MFFGPRALCVLEYAAIRKLKMKTHLKRKDAASQEKHASEEEDNDDRALENIDSKIREYY